MRNIKTFDIVEIVLGEAIDQSNGKLSIADSTRADLIEICDIIDDLIAEFDGESLTAEVADKTNDLIISMVCPDMIWEYGRSHLFFSLIPRVKLFRFSAEEDSLQVEFLFTHVFNANE